LQVLCFPGKQRKINKNFSRKEQQNNNEKTMCVDTACAPPPPKPHAVCHFSRENFRKKLKIQKVKKVFDFSLF
jgi:hypothetical protein